jgi:hypothetical protein
MQQQHLFEWIRKELSVLLNGYIQVRELTENLDSYFAPPTLGDQAAVLAAVVLAKQIR